MPLNANEQDKSLHAHYFRNFMGSDYKKLLKKKKVIYADTSTMGVDIDKNEYYEIILSNSAHPEKIKNEDTGK